MSCFRTVYRWFVEGLKWPIQIKCYHLFKYSSCPHNFEDVMPDMSIAALVNCQRFGSESGVGGVI